MPETVDASFRPTLLMTAGRALGFAGTFCIPVVLARVFGPHEFGTYRQLLLVYTTLFLALPFGMAESLYYFVPRSARDAGRYVANSILYLAVAGAAGLALITAGAGGLVHWLNNPELPKYVGLLGALLTLTVASTLLEMVMISRKRYLAAACAYGLSDLLRAAGFIVPAILFRRLDATLAGAVVFALARLVLGLAWLVGEFPGALRPDRSRLPEQLGYAVPLGASALLEIVHTNFHLYAVSHGFDAATFALYSVGCLQIPLVDFIAGPAGNVLMVRMGEGLRDGAEGALTLWHETTRKLAFFFVPFVALLLLTARDVIVLLFTETYAPSTTVFQIWVVGILLNVLQTDAMLRVHAETGFLLGMNAVRLLLVVVLVGPCVTAFGLPGAVLATLAVGVAAKGAALVRVERRLGTGMGRLLPCRGLAAIIVASALAAVPAWVAGEALGSPRIVHLAAMGLAYAAGYLWLLSRLGGFDPGAQVAQWTSRRAAKCAAVVEGGAGCRAEGA